MLPPSVGDEMEAERLSEFHKVIAQGRRAQEERQALLPGTWAGSLAQQTSHKTTGPSLFSAHE